MSVFHRLLVPLDASDLTDRVLDAAFGTARWSGAEVVLLHVMPTSPSLETGETSDDLDELERQVDSLLDAAKARNDGELPIARDKVKAEVRTGDVEGAIVRAVEELMCDLVVMGTHGRMGLIEQLTGSTTESVTRKVPCSVFVVRPVGFPYLRD